MKKTILILFLLVPILALSQVSNNYPVGVEKVLKKAGKNRLQLEKAIAYFKKSEDPLKIKAIYFLISNMDIHYSANYYWADSAGKHIAYNELDYVDHNLALKAFEEIKSKAPGIHPQAFTYLDIDSIKGDYLIDNVERAFQYWKNPRVKALSFDDFCEYVLPYRVSVEPLQNWRKIYHQKFAWINDSTKGKTIEETLHYFANDVKSWFTNTWQIEQRKEPLPRLGPLQLLSRAKGNCEDIAGLEVYTLRSQGYPAAVDHIPYWATSSGTHYFNNTIDEQLKSLPFDVSTNQVKINNFSREPSKVIRETYSKQITALASFTDLKNIPPGFMRMANCLDVTATHWETGDVNYTFTTKPLSPLAFSCVFSGGKWQPTWWGKIQGSTVNFTNMCKGVVYLPAYYINGKLITTGFPIALGYKQQMILKPDIINKRNISLSWQDKYLVYRPGKKYKLYYWDNGWRFCGEKTATENTMELVFEQVPDNSLMLLLPEYSVGRERPFTVNLTGERQWW